eukprot:Skav235085  [mRNA]  locus=scaffold711:23370:23972:- [translate_table: standard]
MASKRLAALGLCLVFSNGYHGHRGPAFSPRSFLNLEPQMPKMPKAKSRPRAPRTSRTLMSASRWSARSVGFGTVSFANNAVLLLVAICLWALKKPAVSAGVGFVVHAITTGTMQGFRCPIKIPTSFRREARSNLAKSYIAQAILVSLVFTSQNPNSAMVSRYLLFTLVFVTSIFFDWPDPPLLDQAPDLVFPGATGGEMG